MKIQTEQDMKDFCNEVNSSGRPFEIEITRNILSPEQIQKYLGGILLAESAEKVNNYFRGNKLKELFIQGIQDISYDPTKNIVIIDEVPRIYPSGTASKYEGAMTGILSSALAKEKGFVFHMRGGKVSEPFGFQAASAGFGNFGENPYDVFEDELKTEAGIIKKESLLEKKSLGILPFMKGIYPQPLFMYGIQFGSSKVGKEMPTLNSIEEIISFEREIKNRLGNTEKSSEAYPFIIPFDKTEEIVQGIYDRDTTQQGKNGGFFGPIKESHELFLKYL